MRRVSVMQICFLGIAAALNVAGANLALLLRLPVYLDSLGTVLAAILLGPVYGMIPGVLSGIISGCVSDVYAFYYIPVQMVVGGMAGIFYQKIKPNGRRLWKVALTAFCISLPGTLVSSWITASVFGGITSSGSSILVQLLHAGGLEMTASVCIVQAVTDYLDRIIIVFCALLLCHTLPVSMKQKVQKGNFHGTI